MQPYLLLDAGGTILFPDFALVRRLLLPHGVDADEERIRRVATEWTWRLDESLEHQTDKSSLLGFLQDVLARVGAPQQSIPALVTQLQSMDAEKSLWTSTFPWVRRALERLRHQGFRISVISNADGRVRQQLEELGLIQYVEEVFDSHIVGYEKPDARLFQHALNTLGLQRAQCLYVGDVYHIDVLGANRAGIAAVHLDACELYRNWPGCHIRDIAALPDLLTSSGLDLSSELFFPLLSAPLTLSQEPAKS